jgi:hypothetical protein
LNFNFLDEDVLVVEKKKNQTGWQYILTEQ